MKKEVTSMQRNKIPNKYFPTPKLLKSGCIPDIEEEIKPPYVFNKYDQEIVAPDEIKI